MHIKISIITICAVLLSNNLLASTSNKEMFQNFVACAANAIRINDKREAEFYTNAAIDLAYESSDGKISAELVRQGISETASNLKNFGMTDEALFENYEKYCGLGNTRGYATYYYNQRKNMSK